MNICTLVGRLTRDPEVRSTQSGTSVARYTLAVDRRTKKEGEQTADFIPCVVWDRGADFAGKYFVKGMRVAVSGRITTGSYTNREGQKVYTTEVYVDSQEFADEKKGINTQAQADDPDAGLPWNV